MLILDKITVSSANLAPLSTRSMDFNTRMPHSQYVRWEGVSVFLEIVSSQNQQNMAGEI